jgi:hypothetical protein
MINIVTLIEKYCDLNPSLGPTSALSDVLGSVQSSGIVNNRVFHYDEHSIINGSPIDIYLLRELRRSKPNAVFISFYPFEHDPRNVNPNTIRIIRDELRIPTIFLWFDYAHSHIRDLAIKLSNVSSLSVVIDVFDKPNDRFLPMWSPRDERIFNYEENKSVDVSFIGTTNGYGERCRYLSFLQGKVPLHVSGGQREHNLTIEEYARSFQRSKISINFPTKQDESIIQAKGRIFESMLCGSLLLERDNEAIKRWFEPMVHYVPFTNEQDLINKINYYLQNESERKAIVQNANNKMKDHYSSHNWWKTVLNNAGVK